MNKIFKKFIIFLTIIPVILSGCWDQNPIEDTGFITIMGVESAPSGDMKLTYARPVIDPTAKGRGEILDTESSLGRIGREKLNRTSGKSLLAGRIQLILFSNEIAEKGIITKFNSIFERDPSDPILSLIVVVDGSPKNLIHGAENLKDKPRPSTYMNELLQRAIDSAYTQETRVYNYDIISMAPGIDNAVPLIKLNSNSIEVKGSALFCQEKMVGTIDEKQNGLLTAMTKTLKNKKYYYQAGDIGTDDVERPKHGLAVNVGQKSKKISISTKNNKLVVDINLDLTGIIDEYRWDTLRDENKVKQLNQHIQGQIEADCQKLIGYMQSIESDPIGIGDMVRAYHNSYWKGVDWHTAYKNAKITAHVKFNIIQYGATS